MNGERVSGPVIQSIEPNAVPVGPEYPVELLIRGGPFDAEGNVVRLGSELVDTLPSADGVLIRWRMPKTIPSMGEAPPRVIQAGGYPLTVETRAGVSAPRTLTLHHAPR